MTFLFLISFPFLLISHTPTAISDESWKIITVILSFTPTVYTSVGIMTTLFPNIPILILFVLLFRLSSVLMAWIVDIPCLSPFVTIPTVPPTFPILAVLTILIFSFSADLTVLFKDRIPIFAIWISIITPSKIILYTISRTWMSTSSTLLPFPTHKIITTLSLFKTKSSATEWTSTTSLPKGHYDIISK